MTTDHNLWINDINNRFTVTSLTDVTDGDGFVATSVISGNTINSGWRMSLWDAYKDLREKILGITSDETVLPKSTTTQAASLDPVEDGVEILNITESRQEICLSGVFVNTAGDGTMAPSAFGDIFENNESGSIIDSTTKKWVTATLRNTDANGIITFLADSTGDRLVVGTGGAGTYRIFAKCDQTNAGGNITTMTIQVNDVDTTIADEHASDSGDHRPLYAMGTWVLNDGDFLNMKVESSTLSDVITAFHTSIFMQRLS